MEHCEGNCRFGDENYGNDPMAYDGTKCGCVKCPNFLLCRAWQHHGGLCVNCDMSFRKPLVIANAPVDCPICLESKPLSVGHPSECGHTCCIDCLREQWWPDKTPCSDPEDFGFTSVCQCEECTDGGNCSDAFDEWERDYPDQHTEYQEMTDRIEMQHAVKLAERSDVTKCHICRADLSDAPNNSW